MKKNTKTVYLIPFFLFGLFHFCKGEENLKLSEQFDFLSEYYFEQDIRWFLNHKNEEFQKSYLLEATTSIEAMLISFREQLFFGAFYSNHLGMGKQYRDIVFDPDDVNYAINPFLEFRYKGHIFQTGLDHRCFHQIDRNTRKTPYWNQGFIQVASDNYRHRSFNQSVLQDNDHNPLKRLSWNFYAGYFITDFFGTVNPIILSGGHGWTSTIQVRARYAFFSSKSWILSASHAMQFFADTTGTGYWSGQLSVMADLTRYQHGLSFFANYNYDFPRDMPIYSKDQLIELGMNFWY